MDADWVPPDVDTEIPSAARLYDYYLGGAYNFAADRELADQITQVLPEIRQIARANRAFLRRAVMFCVEAGIRQFIDLGCGLPTVGPVHEVAHKIDPGCRVLYVDNEPVAVAHGELLLDGDDRVAIIGADLRDTDAVLKSAQATRLIDLSEPVAVLMAAVLHFVPDEDDPAAVIQRYRDAMAPGSYLVLSHGTSDGTDFSVTERSLELYRRSQNPTFPRTRSVVEAMLAPFDLVEPGLVFVPQWRPASPHDIEAAAHAAVYAAVGRVT
jgi:SAM-dependent methyltransferase